MRLKDKVAIITGAASGIGRAAADRFVREGAVVVISDINEEGIGRAVDEIRSAGGRAIGVRTDVSSQDDVRKLMAKVNESEGRIDILVNNAGISRYRPFDTLTGDDWNQVLDIDLKGVFFGAQAVAPYMKAQEYGRIVNISSALGTGAAPHTTTGSPGGSSAYASAKAGVIMLTKTLAREFGPSGVTVNCVAPGTFVTAISTSTRSPEELEEHLSYRKKTVVMGRIGTLEELSGAIFFFASDDASYVTGQTLFVDGGRSDRM